MRLWRTMNDAPTDSSIVILLCPLWDGRYIEVACRREQGHFKVLIEGLDNQYDRVIANAVAWSKDDGLKNGLDRVERACLAFRVSTGHDVSRKVMQFVLKHIGFL